MNAFIYYLNPLDALTVLKGESLVRRQVKSLLSSGVDRIGIGCKAGPEVNQILNDLTDFDQVTLTPAEEDLGTGGYLFLARSLFESEFLYIDGKSYFEIDFARLEKQHKQFDCSLTVLIQNAINDDPAFSLDASGKVINIDFGGGEGYYRSPSRFMGVAYIGETLAETFEGPAEPLDLMKEIIHPTFATGDCRGYRSTEYIEDVHRISKIEKDLESDLPAQRKLSHKQKCIFLDRDGVLNVFGPYVVEPGILKIKEDAAEAVRLINESGYLAIVATNQPIIAFGESDLVTLEQVHFKLHHLLNQEGAILDDLYFCPHFPEARGKKCNMEYIKACDCRKPGTGMLMRAAEKYNIDLSASWMIGDTTQDVQTGINAGTKTVLITTGDPNPYKRFGDAKSDRVFDSLLEAVKAILKFV